MSEPTPATLVFFRTGIAALVLLPIAARRGGMRALLDRWLPLLIFAAVEIGAPWLTLSTAEQHISSSLAGLLLSLVGVAAMSGSIFAPQAGWHWLRWPWS